MSITRTSLYSGESICDVLIEGLSIDKDYTLDGLKNEDAELKKFIEECSFIEIKIAHSGIGYVILRYCLD